MKTVHSLMKRTMAVVLVVIGTSLAMHDAAAKTQASSTERGRFVRANPCPSTGLNYGSCTGYTVIHVQPLCKGGKSVASNMKWVSVTEAAARARVECKKR